MEELEKFMFTLEIKIGNFHEIRRSHDIYHEDVLLMMYYHTGMDLPD